MHHPERCPRPVAQPRRQPPRPPRLRRLFAVLVGLAALLSPVLAGAAPPGTEPTVTTITTGLEGAVGSTIGPGGDLWVTEAAAGRIARVDRHTGDVTTVATGLPPQLDFIGLGGAMDVAFVDGVAYVLVTLVGPEFGAPGVVGIHRIDGPGTVTPVADIGSWALANPPSGFPFFVRTGVQYALEAFRGALLVTDGHHNRVLRVTVDGEVSELIAFGSDLVPTGLEARGRTIHVGLAGPTPHLPADGRVVSIDADGSDLTGIAAGARLLVDVEYGTGGRLFTLSQGVFPVGAMAGAPAIQDTGALLVATADGGMTELVAGLDRPTSLEVVGNTAWVVTLDGEVLRIDGLPRPGKRN